MAKYNVYLMTMYLGWEGIEAESKEEAIAQCSEGDNFDYNEPHTWVAREIEEEEPDGDENL